uniref:Uncharacterized protein n=1 Tax=Anopheles minimus TaxID=112268 RepID=A0A182W5U0_9DIPT
MPPSANPAYRIETPIPSVTRFDHDCIDGGGVSTVASTSSGAASSTAKEEEIAMEWDDDEGMVCLRFIHFTNGADLHVT